jgi:uncharacterized OB-fold protein
VSNEAAAARPVPVADDLTLPFWDAVARGELVIQYCTGCGRYQHPPDVICYNCGTSAHHEYRPVSGRGRIYTFSIVHVTRQAAFEALVPYPVVIVELTEQSGLFMTSNILGTDPAGISIGATVEFWAEQTQPGVWLAQFRLTANAKYEES